MMMKTDIKVLRSFCSIVCLVILAAACGPAATTAAPAPATVAPANPAPANPAPATAAPATAAPAAPTEVTTIDVMHYYGEGVADQPMMVVWGQQFEALYPQYKIKWTWGGSDVETLFQARMNANDSPDLFATNDAHVATYARNGIIQPLDQYLDTQNFEKDSVWKDTFYPGLLENGHITDGKMGDHFYGIPDNMHFGGVFYNKGLFEKNNYQIPKTWPDLLALCDKIQKDQKTPCFAADNFPDYNATSHFFIMWMVMGAQKVYDTGMGKAGTSFNDPDFLKAAKLYQQLTTKYFAPGWDGNQWPAGQVDFANEGEAMIFMPTWLPSELMTVKAADFTMGMFPMPTLPDGYTGKPDLEVKFNGWMIPVGAKHNDAAMAFVKFLTSKAYQLARSTRASLISPLKAVPLPPDLADMATALNSSNVVRFSGGLDADAYDWQTGVLFPLNDQLAMGKMTPEKFIEELDKQTKAYYAAKK
jgi:raffinose/stachyose/melibiose transport system substrate-binding protein